MLFDKAPPATAPPASTPASRAAADPSRAQSNVALNAKVNSVLAVPRTPVVFGHFESGVAAEERGGVDPFGQPKQGEGAVEAAVGAVGGGVQRAVYLWQVAKREGRGGPCGVGAVAGAETETEDSALLVECGRSWWVGGAR